MGLNFTYVPGYESNYDLGGDASQDAIAPLIAISERCNDVGVFNVLNAYVIAPHLPAQVAYDADDLVNLIFSNQVTTVDLNVDRNTGVLTVALTRDVTGLIYNVTFSGNIKDQELLQVPLIRLASRRTLWLLCQTVDDRWLLAGVNAPLQLTYQYTSGANNQEMPTVTVTMARTSPYGILPASPDLITTLSPI